MNVAPDTYTNPTCIEEVIRALAARPADDLETATVLLDALLEHPHASHAWHDERVMMLCLGVPLDKRPPAKLGEQGRRTWRQQRKASIWFARSQWDLYVGRDDFRRATIALRDVRARATESNSTIQETK